MVNGDEEIQWGYLLDPTFQLVNTKGAPLTNGWIECYIHGTRTPYYCASDFDGTLHPFKIPLDSLGSNIVLANLELAYDVYVYNKYGTLIMSRYNVTPGRGGGGISGVVKTEIVSESIDVTKTYDPETNTNIFDIELKNNGESQHWIGQNGSSIVIDPDEEDQNERTLPFPTSQNRDYIGSFVNRIEYGKFMYLEPGLYLVNCVIDFHQDIANLENEIGQVLVYTGAGNANEDVAFERDDTGPDTSNNRHCLKMTFIRKVLGEDETSHIDCSNLLYFAPKTEVLWNQCSIKKLSIVKLDQGNGFTRVIHDNTIEGDGTEDNPLTVSGTVNHIYEVITSATSGKLDSSAYVAPVQSDWNQNDPDALDFILNKPNLGSYATHQEVVEATSGKLDTSAYTAPVQSDWTQNDSDALDYIKNKPENSELIPGPGIDITASGNNYVISSTASGDVTKQYVDEHLAQKLDTSAYESPVQSDWNENDPDDLSFIKNKPTECSLIAGQNVWLEDLTSGVRINCSGSGGGGSGVTEEYVQEAVASATSGKLDIEDYTAPVQSDWNQSNSSMLDYIKNKPEASQLLEGPGISITASGNDFVIGTSGSVSEQYVQDAISSAISDLPSTSYVDETVQSATSGKLDTSAYTAPVQSDWSQPDADALSFIKNKPTECSLLAGENVWIEDTTSGVRINCSAQGGGGPVPEGVMTESELKYNAVGEISGYGDSAIAQYGAEKQWLVHDDTIVHMSNSAQYAFGVNLSAVAQLLGIDETVLFEGSSSTSCPLSEPYSAFNKLKIKYIDDSEAATNYYNGPYTYLADTEDIMNNPQHMFVLAGVKTNGIGDNRDKLLIRLGWWSASSADISLVPNTNKQFYQSFNGTANSNMRVTKVVGIGRKQST